MKITLAVDAMGGDNAPKAVIEGVSLALKRYPKAHFILFGDEQQIQDCIKAVRLDVSRIEIRHSDEIITPDMKPSAALRRAKGSSMRMAIEAVKNGDADAVVSAGNTGAYMALSKIILRTLRGIDRPAITAPLPTATGSAVMLDLGANVDCDTNNIVQFAIMGEIYSKAIHGISSPSVGLLNVGEEDTKGNSTVQEAAQIIREHGHIKNFSGFIEGNDIFLGNIDVIVTDGFSGNISLKTAEGASKMFSNFFKNQVQGSFWNKIRYFAARKLFKDFKAKFDPRIYNGAPFLGLNGIAVKSHGGCDGFAFSYAVGVAYNLVDQKVIEQIAHEVEACSPDAEGSNVIPISAGIGKEESKVS